MNLPTGRGTADLLGMLLGRDVYFRDAPITPADNDMLAVYRNDDDVAVAVWRLSLPLAAGAAAQLVALPPSRAQECVKAGALDDALNENFNEVANVFGVLVNDADADRLRLVEVIPAKDAAADVQAILTGAGRKASWHLDVDGRFAGHAQLSLLL